MEPERWSRGDQKQQTNPAPLTLHRVPQTRVARSSLTLAAMRSLVRPELVSAAGRWSSLHLGAQLGAVSVHGEMRRGTA